MATVRIYDGKTYEDVEVTDELAAEYAEMEHREYLNNRKETRRHQSLDRSMEHGFDIADEEADVWEQVADKDNKDRLYQAIALLSPEQQKLLRRIYFERIPQTEIARSEKVSAVAIP